MKYFLLLLVMGVANAQMPVLDSDGDGIPDAVDPCTELSGADLNDDCVINFGDLSIMRSVFFTSGYSCQYTLVADIDSPYIPDLAAFTCTGSYQDAPFYGQPEWEETHTYLGVPILRWFGDDPTWYPGRAYQQCNTWPTCYQSWLIFGQGEGT